MQSIISVLRAEFKGKLSISFRAELLNKEILLYKLIIELEMSVKNFQRF